MSMSIPSGGPPDPEALARLRRAIHAYIFGRVKDPALADDIAQETLLRLHLKFGTVRDGERLEAWVFQTARNAVADHFRRAKPVEPFEEQIHTTSAERDVNETLAAEEETLRRELAGYVRGVVEGLPGIYREALLLTEFEGISQVELARRLGLSVSAAKSRVQRARGMVRGEMERCCRWETDHYGTVMAVEPRREDCCDKKGGFEK